MEKRKAAGVIRSVWSWVIKRPIVLMILAYLIFTAFVIPDFYTGRNVKNYLIQCSDTVVFACGMMFVMVNGGIDFSGAAVIGMGSWLAARIMSTKSGWMPGHPLAIPLAILVMLAVGIAGGAINGFAVTRLKIPSFIATMSSNMILMGVTLTLSMSATVAALPGGFTKLGSGTLLGIPYQVMIAAAVVAISAVMINRSAFGRRALAVGANPTAANVAGLPVKKTIMQLFLVNGLLAGIGIVMFTARMGVGKAGLGETRVLDFVASCIIGGTSPGGGSVTVLGTVLGAMFIMLINNSLNMLGLPWYTITIAKGAFVVIMALADAYRSHLEQTR